MAKSTRTLVRARAGERCEYCRFPDEALELPFHVEHIVASIHRVDDRIENLAWACPRCNLRKGPNLTTIDPETNDLVNLFHPREMRWADHFAVRDGLIVGITAVGRGAVHLLDMNNELRAQHRRELIAQNCFELE